MESFQENLLIGHELHMARRGNKKKIRKQGWNMFGRFRARFLASEKQCSCIEVSRLLLCS